MPQASKQLRCWGQAAGGAATYHEMIARDKEVVKAVLLLTGSVEGTKNQVGLDCVSRRAAGRGGRGPGGGT